MAPRARALALAAALLFLLAAPAQARPAAVAGALDLRGWSFPRDGVADLAGEWEFAWGRLEEPGGAGTAGGRIRVPAPWNEASVPGKPSGGEGYATYRLRVECSETARLALVMPIQHSAVRLYVNGRVLAQQGSPGTSRELAYPAFVQQVVPLEGAACPLDIVAQVSNYDMRNGGLLRSIELGTERQLVERRERGLARDLFALGGIAMLSLLPVLVFLWRRQDRAPLWLAVYGLSSAMLIGLGGERLFQPFIAPLGWQSAWKIVFLFLLAGLAAFPAFLRALYPAAFPRALLHALLALTGGFALLVVLAPTRVFTQATPLLYALAVAGALAGLVVPARAALRGRRDAWLLVAGTAVLLACGVHDTLLLPYQIADKLTPYGLLGFALAPVLLLALRFTRALRAEQLHSVELQQRLELAARVETINGLLAELRHGEEALRRSDARYDAAMRAINQGVYDWDVEHGSIFYSEGVYRVLGMPESMKTPQDWAERIHPEDRAKYNAGILAHFKGETERFECEYRYRGPDGAWRWARQHGIAIRNAQGHALRMVGSTGDITAQRNAEQALADERQRLALVVRATQAGIIDWDTSTESPWYSERFREMLGYPLDFDTSGWASLFGSLMHPEDRDRSREVFFTGLVRKGAANGVTVQEPLELRLRCADGSWLWVQSHGLTLHDDEGEAQRYLAAVTDISARRAQDEALRNQFKFVNDLVDSVPVALALRDPEGKYLLVNRRWEEYFGAKREEVLGRTVRERAGASMAEALLKLDRAVLERGPGALLQEDDFEYRGRKFSQTRSVMADEQGRVLGVLIASLDTTERNAMEQALALQRERLALLVRSTKAGFMDWDAASDTRVYSERFKEMLGYPPDADTASWPSLFEMMHPEDREPMREAFRAMLRQGNAAGDRLHGPLEYRLRKTDGSYLWVRGEGIAQVGADGRTERFLTSYIDITPLREMNLALEESVRLREEVDRIGRHDLKTPLNSIIGIPRLLRDSGRLSAEDAELLAFVEQAGFRLLNMVNLSLDMFRMERGNYPFTPKAVDLHAILGKVARDLAAHAKSKRIELRIEGPRLHAQAEELLCYSLFANLVKNALEASAEDGAVVLTVADAGAGVTVSVHNSGAVPQAVRARFFDKYATAGKQSGSGLGTYSARLMARTQEGDIEMQTSEAAGTTLTVRLKQAAAPARDADPGKTEIPEQAPESPPRELSVLVVDDDEYTRIFVQRSLPASLRTATAINGRDAVEAVKRAAFEVIVMDLDMPVMGGLEAARLIRQWEAESGRARCAMIAMSSNDGPEFAERSKAAGFDRYLAKPVSPDAIWRAISEIARSLPPGPGPRPAEAVRVQENLRHALPGFLASRRELVGELEAALAQGDAARARALAHKLAGSFALYGFQWAAAQGKMIERRAGANALEGLAAEAAALRRHLDSVRVECGDQVLTEAPP